MGLSARFDVMEILEKRVKSRFSHRRDIVLELDAAGFDHPDSGVPSLLTAMLALPVRCLIFPRPCLIRQHASQDFPSTDLGIFRQQFGHQEEVQLRVPIFSCTF